VREKKRRRAGWDAGKVKALRSHMGLTQDELAQELGTRQQTISEWETGMYQPRGISERLLAMVAERAGFEYEAREG
jgi:DNA-binding transcriptional regulator YiaG